MKIQKAVRIAVACLVAIAIAGSIASAQTLTITTTVSGTSGPWQWVDGGLNTGYQYGLGIIGAPTVVSAANGFRFSVGDGLTVSYISGLVDSSKDGDNGYWDANGDKTFIMNNGNFGWVGPSYYMNPATYPIYLGELVGTFANNSGQIVGTPFAVGNLGTFTVPTGATQLQLGINDTIEDDNLGSFNIQITGVPEPTSLSLLAFGMLGIVILVKYRR